MSDGTDSATPRSGSSGGKFVPPSTEQLDAIFNQYEFIEILGQGGMGAVYKARQKSLDREVAIKILPADLTGADEEDGGDGFQFAERFQREARAMAKLSHPNIIAVYDFGQASDGQLYIVMEFVEGTDLHALIRTGELTLGHALGWTPQICDALQYAHNQGIVHRDIKPANIMISRDSQVKIADFGLAKLTGAGEIEGGLTMTNMAMGTPDYIAPEALEQGNIVDHRADLYAVGVMLYEMFTGRVPRGSWKSPSSQVPGLDTRYDALVERAMDADRDGRFQNATDIASTLYEISTTSAAPLTAGGKKLITGAAASGGKAISGGHAVSGVVHQDLHLGEEDADDVTAEESPVSSGTIEKPRSKVALVGGLIAGAVAIALIAFVLLRGGDDPDEIVATEPPPGTVVEAPASAAEPTDPAPSTDTTEPPAPESAPETVTVAAASPTEEPSGAASPVEAPMVASAAPEPSVTTAKPVVPAEPSTPSNQPIPPSGPVTDSMDLLSVLSVTRDSLPNQTGESSPKLWKSAKGNTIRLVAPEAVARIAAPVSLQDHGDCEIEFVWKGKLQGEDSCMVLEVPMDADQWIRVKIAIAGDKIDIGGRRQGLTGSFSHNANGMRVAVRRIGKKALVVTIDGKEVANWQEAPAVMELVEADLAPHPLFAGAQLPILTGIKGEFTILEWTLRSFGGELAVLEDPRIAGDSHLAALEEGFQKAYERDANAAFLAGLANLEKGYGGALERARKAAQKKGALDDIVAIRKEKQRLSSGADLPATNPPDTPAVVAKLINTYRTAHTKLESERNAKTIPLYDKYLSALSAYEAQLTKADDIDKALAIRDYRKLIVIRRSELEAIETPIEKSDSVVMAEPKPATGPAPSPDTSSRSSSMAERKDLAAWLLSIGARFTVLNKDGQPIEISKDAPDLPPGSFSFQRIYIERPPDSVTDQDFNRLDAAEDLVHLELKEFKVSRLPALRRMNQLQELVISRCPQLSIELFGDLGRRPMLKRLHFLYGGSPPPAFSNEALAGLAASPSLEWVRFESVALEDPALANLAGISSLKSLVLTQPRKLKGSFLTAFGGHPSFEKLECWSLNPENFDGIHFAALETTKNFKNLSFDGTRVSPEGFAAIGKLSNLQRLNIFPSLSVDDEALMSLAPLAKLQAITIRALKAEGTAFSAFQCGPNLKSLTLYDGSMTNDAGLAAIATTFPKLTSLNVEGNDFGIEGIEKISTLKSLSTLSMMRPSELGNEALKPLAKMGSLTELSLLRWPMNGTAAAHLAGIRNLQKLTLWSGTIDIEVFPALADHRSLNQLNLHSIPGGFLDEWIPAIKEMRPLKVLWLSGSGVTVDNGRLQEIRDALPKLRVDP